MQVSKTLLTMFTACVSCSPRHFSINPNHFAADWLQTQKRAIIHNHHLILQGYKVNVLPFLYNTHWVKKTKLCLSPLWYIYFRKLVLLMNYGVCSL